jgi:hypothetical protein
MRHFMACPQNEEMLHKIPPHVVAMIRKDAARDLRLWIGAHYPAIKGWTDINVEEALAVVEGAPHG